MLDAVNQLEDNNSAINMHWIPNKIPSKVKFIISTIPNSKPYQGTLTPTFGYVFLN
jgi:hypothetical protein